MLMGWDDRKQRKVESKGKKLSVCLTEQTGSCGGGSYRNERCKQNIIYPSLW